MVHGLDQRRAGSWLALVALALVISVVAACSNPTDDAASSASALAQSGRWTLPSDVLAAGASVRLRYDDAPKWTGSAACSGRLTAGGRKLGEYLIDHFAGVSTVGGYACRRNTADASRMSVHGTGRALDLFIPKAGNAADNDQGDRVANWLVRNAARIGVQLVIWDRTVWFANGNNDDAYRGPNPHIDHIHVELTKGAAAMSTQWFADMAAADPSADGGAADPADTADAGSMADGSPSVPDPVDPGAPADDPAADPADDDHAADDTLPSDADAAAPPSADPAPSTTDQSPQPTPPSGAVEAADDEPGEPNSLPDRPTSSRRAAAPSYEDEPIPTAGCSAAARGSVPAPGAAALLAFAVGLAAFLRRKRA